MNEKDKRWWLQPLSYGYVGLQAAPTGLLQQQTVPDTESVIGLAGPLPTYEVPTYQPVSAPFAQQWDTGVVPLPTTAVNTLEDQAIAAYEALPATTPIAEPTVSIGLSDATPLPDPTFGLAATDPNLLGVTPFSTASTAMTPAQINAGMAEVDLPFFSRFPLAEQGMDQGTFDAIEHIDAIYGGSTQESTKDTTGRMLWKDVVEKIPTDSKLGNAGISYVMRKGLPFRGFVGDDVETATTAESIKDALNNILILDAKKSGIPKDDLIASVVTGVNPLIQTNADQLSAAADLVSKGGKLDRDDAVDMAFQIDSFRELVPQVIAKPAPRTTPAARNVVEEAEKARMRELARQQELAKRVYDQLMSGRDRGEPSAREIQAAMERATQVDSFSDRRGEVQAAMRDVGYGGSNWT